MLADTDVEYVRASRSFRCVNSCSLNEYSKITLLIFIARVGRPLSYYWERKDELNSKYTKVPIVQPAVPYVAISSSSSSSARPLTLTASSSNQPIDLTSTTEDSSSSSGSSSVQLVRNHKTPKRSKLNKNSSDAVTTKTTLEESHRPTERIIEARIIAPSDTFSDKHDQVNTSTIHTDEYESKMNRIKMYLNLSATAATSSSAPHSATEGKKKSMTSMVGLHTGGGVSSSSAGGISSSVNNSNSGFRLSSSSQSAVNERAQARASLPPRQKQQYYDESFLRAPKGHVLVAFDQEQETPVIPLLSSSSSSSTVPVRVPRARVTMTSSTPVSYTSTILSHASAPVSSTVPVADKVPKIARISKSHSSSDKLAATSNATDKSFEPVMSVDTHQRRAKDEARNRLNGLQDHWDDSADKYDRLNTLQVDDSIEFGSDLAFHELPAEAPVFMWADTTLMTGADKFKKYKENRFIVYHREEPIITSYDPTLPTSTLSSSSTTAAVAEGLVDSSRQSTGGDKKCPWKLYLGKIGAKEDFMTVAFVKPFEIEPHPEKANLYLCR